MKLVHKWKNGSSGSNDVEEEDDGDGDRDELILCGNLSLMK